MCTSSREAPTAVDPNSRLSLSTDRRLGRVKRQYAEAQLVGRGETGVDCFSRKTNRTLNPHTIFLNSLCSCFARLRPNESMRANSGGGRAQADQETASSEPAGQSKSDGQALPSLRTRCRPRAFAKDTPIQYTAKLGPYKKPNRDARSLISLRHITRFLVSTSFSRVALYSMPRRISFSTSCRRFSRRRGSSVASGSLKVFAVV